MTTSSDTDRRSDQPAIAPLEAELTMLARALEAVQRRRAYSLDRAAYLLIGLVEREGPQPVGEIARRLLLDGSTVTRQVAAMEKAGLVRKAPNPADARQAVVDVTDLGIEKAREMREQRYERLERVLADWSETDRDAAAALLSRLNRTLHASLAEG